MSRIGIIGGSGIYELSGLEVKDCIDAKTPFGAPSDKLVVADFEGREIVFLPRHGKGHKLLPSEINYRANIYAMKELDVEQIISVSACGSLKKELKPLDFVVPDQFVDRTNQSRKYTFFGDGIVAHVMFADPVCPLLAKVLYDAAKAENINAHFGGTYLNMEGPQFSTRAESNLYRSWGMDIIGMTNLAEARLAKEAEICYATLAAITDYDCWYDGEETVTVDVVIATFKKNIENAKKILARALLSVSDRRECGCKEALKGAIMTDPAMILPEVKVKLRPIIGKYIS
ncbi:MAG: S-methyl-5'-thioadenosine phosphorylase [Candidatus Omnitrophica bacterium]|nr:S-methyl-5'-thioadenosine phosphorylase [Candidatus Omnitrophota bacterium]